METFLIILTEDGGGRAQAKNRCCIMWLCDETEKQRIMTPASALFVCVSLQMCCLITVVLHNHHHHVFTRVTVSSHTTRGWKVRLSPTPNNRLVSSSSPQAFICWHILNLLKHKAKKLYRDQSGSYIPQTGEDGCRKPQCNPGCVINVITHHLWEQTH